MFELLILTFISAAAREASFIGAWQRAADPAIYEARRKINHHGNLWMEFIERRRAVEAYVGIPT